MYAQLTDEGLPSEVITARIIPMKKDIHPPYYPNATVRCACGNIFKIGSTKELIETEICSKCHPFYTGKGKFIDTAGRIEKYKAKLEKKKKLGRPAKQKK